MKIHKPKSARSSKKGVDGLTNLCNFLNENQQTKIMVEVGSYMGESTVIFSKNIGCVIYCVDPWTDYTNNGIMVVGMSEVEQNFNERTKNFNNIIKTKGFSQEKSLLFEDNSLDFVYIDANHDYNPVKQDINFWLPKIKKGCFIGGHDYNKNWQGVMDAVNEQVGLPDYVFEDTSWIKRIV